MKNRGILFVFILVLLSINFVTASFHYGGYSLSNLLNSFDSSTVILTSIFLIAFILIFWPLSKFFRENPLLAGIISFAISFLFIFEINRRGYDFTGFFYSIGISGGILYTIAPLILLAGFFYISYSKEERRFKFYRGFFVLGGLLIGILIFTDIIYEGSKGITFILGTIFLGIGILLLWRRGKRGGFAGSSYPPSKSPRGIDYAQETSRLRDKQNYDYYRKLEEQKERQASQQRRSQERELRRQQSQEKKLRDRYARRYGRRAAKKRFGT